MTKAVKSSIINFEYVVFFLLTLSVNYETTTSSISIFDAADLQTMLFFLIECRQNKGLSK